MPNQPEGGIRSERDAGLTGVAIAFLFFLTIGWMFGITELFGCIILCTIGWFVGVHLWNDHVND